MKYHICCSTDEGYVQHCAVMLCSLLENNKGDTLIVHILTPGLCDETQQRLTEMIRSYNSDCRFHQVDDFKLKGIGGVQIRKVFSNYVPYYKLLLSSIIDEETTIILYLDSDTVINGEITHIFNLDITMYALAAVEDIPIEYEHRMHMSLPYNAEYFNSGVMLVNLGYWRRKEAEEHLLQSAKRERYTFFHDQDALNAVFHSQWLSLHPRLNKFNTYLYLSFPRFLNWKDEFLFKKYPLIIHYAGYLKPWYNIPFIPYKSLYFKYLRLTPWKDCQKSYKISHAVILRLIVYILQRMHLNFIVRRIAIYKYRKDIQTR
jgi:lipopolysaccharide biosynthesis glycosyltransferase